MIEKRSPSDTGEGRGETEFKAWFEKICAEDVNPAALWKIESNYREAFLTAWELASGGDQGVREALTKFIDQLVEYRETSLSESLVAKRFRDRVEQASRQAEVGVFNVVIAELSGLLTPPGEPGTDRGF